MFDVASQLAPLSTALPADAAPTILVFDIGVGPTLPELRDPRTGQPRPGPAQAHVRDALADLDQALCELTLSRVAGRLEPRAETEPALDTLEVTRTILKVEAACSVYPELLGRQIHLVLGCSTHGRVIEPFVDVRFSDGAGLDTRSNAARANLEGVATELLARCAAFTIAPWIEASGLTAIAAEAVLDLPHVHGAPPEIAAT